MTKDLIKKNMSLSLEFDRYVSGKPSVLKSVPSGASIVITSANDKKLSEANRSFFRNSLSGRFVEAHKSGGSWTIKPLTR